MHSATAQSTQSSTKSWPNSQPPYTRVAPFLKPALSSGLPHTCQYLLDSMLLRPCNCIATHLSQLFQSMPHVGPGGPALTGSRIAPSATIAPSRAATAWNVGLSFGSCAQQLTMSRTKAGGSHSGTAGRAPAIMTRCRMAPGVRPRQGRSPVASSHTAGHRKEKGQGRIRVYSRFIPRCCVARHACWTSLKLKPCRYWTELGRVCMAWHLLTPRRQT